MNVIQADVFDILKEYEQNGRLFDMIILDPPAFAKNAKALDKVIEIGRASCRERV